MSQKNPPVRIKAIVIADAKKALKSLAKAPPDDYRLKEAVHQIIPEILDARASLHNDEVIAETLRSLGIQISASTLGSYVRDYLRNHKPMKPAAPEAQIGETEAKTCDSDGIAYIPIEDMQDESDEELAARIQKRRTHEEVDETLADLEDPLEVLNASETNEEQV